MLDELMTLKLLKYQLEVTDGLYEFASIINFISKCITPIRSKLAGNTGGQLLQYSWTKV